MKEIHKQYELKGLTSNIKTFKLYKDSFIVNVTRDKRGASLSIGVLNTGLQYTIPIDQILRDLGN